MFTTLCSDLSTLNTLIQDKIREIKMHREEINAINVEFRELVNQFSA